jgi:hypothetical protein
MGGEQDQNLERLRWKVKQDSAFAQLTTPEVEFKGPEPQQCFVSCALAQENTSRGRERLLAADYTLSPSQQRCRCPGIFPSAFFVFGSPE